MKRQNILVIIAFLAAGGYFVSLQFPKNERIAWGRRQQKNNRPEGSGLPSDRQSHVELELKIEQLNGLLQAIIQANLARHKVEQEHPQPDLIQKLQEVTAQKEALGQELIQAKASLELVRPMNPALPLDKESLSVRNGGAKQKENTADKNRIENLAKQLKEKEDTQAALKEQLDEEKANRQAASRSLKSASEELMLAKNTKSALEHALSETEKEKDAFKTTNTSLKLEIKKSEKELTSLKNTLGQLSKEKQALAKELDGSKAAGLKTEQSRKEKEHLRAELELLNKAYTDLQNEYLAALEVIKQNETESGRRADRILVLQEKLAKAEIQLADTQLKYAGMEKESALGREQNVEVQLEREDLKNQLQRAKLRLNELETQASQILKLLKSAGEVKVTLPKEESKRIEVELYPVKNTETIPEEASK